MNAFHHYVEEQVGSDFFEGLKSNLRWRQLTVRGMILVSQMEVLALVAPHLEDRTPLLWRIRSFIGLQRFK